MAKVCRTPVGPLFIERLGGETLAEETETGEVAPETLVWEPLVEGSPAEEKMGGEIIVGEVRIRETPVTEILA